MIPAGPDAAAPTAARAAGTLAARAGLGRLNPSLAHHIVNTLGWADLRPLQSEAIGPLLAGEDALLLAPTAGGKTEAAVFPLLSRMTAEGWGAPSLIYLAPLKALLNNLLPRLEAYCGWVGRRAALWHGDVTSGGAGAAAARSAGRAADDAGVAGGDAGQRQR